LPSFHPSTEFDAVEIGIVANGASKTQPFAKPMSPAELRNLAAEAKRLGGLELKAAGDVIEVGFSTVLTPQEIKDLRVTD